MALDRAARLRNAEKLLRQGKPAAAIAEYLLIVEEQPREAAAFQEFVTRVPNHIPALMRLVEICLDGGLEATMYGAQAQLADAYITAGSAVEARFIAEDLVARALAICMELHAEVGDYRDIPTRIDRLSRVQSRG